MYLVLRGREECPGDVAIVPGGGASVICVMSEGGLCVVYI